MKTPALFRTLVPALAVLLVSITYTPSAHGAPGDLDLSFDPGSGVDGAVHAVALQADGKAIIAGEFSTVKGLSRICVARLNADGSGDSSFDAGSVVGKYASVYCVAFQPDGKWLIGGSFSTARGAARGYVARLNGDGSLDDSFHPPAFGTDRPDQITVKAVRSISLQPDGKVLITGYFPEISDTVSWGFARLNADGSLDTSFAPNTFRLYVGPGGVDVAAAQPDGRILIGGTFTSVNGISRRGIARLNADGSLDPTFDTGTGVNGSVRGLALQADGKVCFGGPFTKMDGRPANNMARLQSDGRLDNTFRVSIDGAVELILPQADGDVFISGYFSTVNGVSRKKVARIDASGEVDPTFSLDPAANDVFRAMAVRADGKVIIGGEFITLDGGHNIAQFNADGTLDNHFDPGGGIDAGVTAVALQTDGKVLIGGHFSTIKGLFRRGIARLNANGSADAGFNRPSPFFVDCIAVQSDGKIMIGSDNLARLNNDGTLDPGFVPPPPGEGLQYDVHWESIALEPDGKMLVSGGYRYIETTEEATGVISRSMCRRLNADGSLAASFVEGGDYSPPVYAVALQPDGKVLAGDRGIARFNHNGTLDAGFEPHAGWGGIVLSVAIQPDHKILIAGWFPTPDVGGYNIARLNADGTVDVNFISSGTEESGIVNSIALQPNGKILIGGLFTTINGTSRKNIARLNADGTLDNSFNAGTETNDSVHSIVVQADGHVLIAGDFTIVNGAARPRVARLLGDPPLPDNFAAWAAGFGLSGAAAAADADPDHDGLASGIEFVLNGNPTLPAASSLPDFTTSGGDVVFTFPRDDASEVDGVTLTVESGTDLVSWPDVFSIGPNTTASSPGVTILENGTAPDTITVAIPAGAGNARFARLKATIAP